jgi:Multidrug resistance efflux pump
LSTPHHRTGRCPDPARGVRRRRDGHLKCLRTKYFCPAPPAESRCGGAGATVFHALSGGDRQHGAIKNVDLVARVQGFLQSINYKDGAFVKEGTPLFTIEPDTYKLKLEQAQAAETARRQR